MCTPPQHTDSLRDHHGGLGLQERAGQAPRFLEGVDHLLVVELAALLGVAVGEALLHGAEVEDDKDDAPRGLLSLSCVVLEMMHLRMW